jgi:superfamily I DNA and/or RNA helicase
VQNVNEDILLEGFRWKNADQILKSYLGESTININKEIKGIENEILEKSESLLLNQAILKFIQKIPSRDSLISLLQKWQKAIEQGKRSGKRAQRYKRDAKLILSQIKDQIPCWVIPMHSLTETLAPKPELFDYIIVDEASQIGAEGIFLNYITKNIIIVGDDKQTSPQTVGVKVDEINQLIDIHLTEFPSKNFFGTENSFFDHAKMTSGVSIVLTEHFRCMPEIIEFCNQEFYAPGE